MTDIVIPDEALTASILAAPPFISIEGVFNFRDSGLSASLPLSSNSAPTQTKPSVQIRPGIVYRSGELTRLTENGKQQLEKLGIKAIFDFRSASEIAKYKGHTPLLASSSSSSSSDGSKARIEIYSVPVTDKDEYDPGVLARRVASFAADEKTAFATLYKGIWENGAPAFETVLKWIRDHPGEACLVHCTAGKDRTGVFAALLHLLLSVPDDHIIYDYHLTTFGLAPALPALVKRFQRESLYRDNAAGFQAMGSAKRETMIETLRIFRETYGDVEGYVKRKMGLGKEDLEMIRGNLRVPSALVSAPLSISVSMSTGSEGEYESEPGSVASSTWGMSEGGDKAESDEVGCAKDVKLAGSSESSALHAFLWLGCVLALAAAGWAYAK